MVWILIITIILCVGVLLLRGMKGPTHSIKTLERPIRDLLRRGFDGGFLIIDIARSKLYIQLRKYINAPGDYGIELCFPDSKWSSQFLEELKNFCSKEGIEYSITNLNIDGPLEFICIDFEKDYQKAHRYVEKILLEIFRVDKDVKLFVRLENATVEDKLIDR